MDLFAHAMFVERALSRLSSNWSALGHNRTFFQYLTLPITAPTLNLPPAPFSILRLILSRPLIQHLAYKIPVPMNWNTSGG